MEGNAFKKVLLGTAIVAGSIINGDKAMGQDLAANNSGKPKHEAKNEPTPQHSEKTPVYIKSNGRDMLDEMKDKFLTDHRVYGKEEQTQFSDSLVEDLKKILEESLKQVLDKIAEEEDTLRKNPNDEFLKLALLKHREIRDNYYQNLDAKSLAADISASKKWLHDNISSPAYLDKLINGEGLSPEQAKKEQQERLCNHEAA